MALKSNFEDADFISSPFVDEVANPGQGIFGMLQDNVNKQSAALGKAKISKEDRDRVITPAQRTAQDNVDRAQAKHGDPKNKNLAKAEGR